MPMSTLLVTGRIRILKNLPDSNSNAHRGGRDKYLSGFAQLPVALCSQWMLLYRNEISEPQLLLFFKGSQKFRFKCEFSILLKCGSNFLLLKHCGSQKTISVGHEIKFHAIMVLPFSLSRAAEKARRIRKKETSQRF